MIYRNTYKILFNRIANKYHQRFLVGLCIILFGNFFIGVVNINKRGKSVNIKIMLQSERIDILKIDLCENRKMIVTIHDF